MLRIRIHTFFGLQVPDRLVVGMDPDHAPDLEPSVIVILVDFLFLQKDVNIGSKSNNHNKFEFKNLFLSAILKVNVENNRIRIQDPGLLIRGKDPRIRIRPKRSLIRNTGSYVNYLDLFIFTTPHPPPLSHTILIEFCS